MQGTKDSGFVSNQYADLLNSSMTDAKNLQKKIIDKNNENLKFT